MISHGADVTHKMLIRAYRLGVFPMAQDAEADEIYWVDPETRALIPLNDRFHVPKRLAKTMRQQKFAITVNTAFADVMRACAASDPAKGRERTWINHHIHRLYNELHQVGIAHSVEVWDSARLAGGLYGVALGGAFFGESMFSRKTDASKVALVALVDMLRERGFTLLDTQFKTDHLTQFGTYTISREDYHALLRAALVHQTEPFGVPVRNATNRVITPPSHGQ